MEEFITDVTLVSAYDIHYRHIAPPFTFPELIFLDSGGFEASKDRELSDLGYLPHEPDEWSMEMHNAVLDGWRSDIPTVVISYDHPDERRPVADQIARAMENIGHRKGVSREILLKPETGDQKYLKISSVVANIHDLAQFDIIGVTEKEIGSSVQARMKFIACLREALTKAGLDTPIHIFGSLDTISTPLYYAAGADLFDGLTWLRFGYFEGHTVYKNTFGTLKLGADTAQHIVESRAWSENYYYLKKLERAMRRFLNEHDFDQFPYHRDLIRECFDSTVECLED
ncbi:MAG: hypothetical protein RIA64_16520 [Rhodospirillales bacterium]